MSKPKKTYRVRNWREYNASLVQRGSLTLWVSEEVIEQWRSCVKGTARGRPQVYPDSLILCAFQLKARYNLSLRGVEGFLKSVITLLGLELRTPDYTTLFKRQKKLKIPLRSVFSKGEGLHFVVDSTGLKIFGEGEWKTRRYGIVKKRLWRKLHLAINAETQMIEGCELSDLGTQDCEAFPRLLDAIESPVETAIGDGAYDRFSCYEAVEKRGTRGIFPPQHNAVTSQERTSNKEKASPEAVSKRDEAIRSVRALGRDAWKQQTGYHRRSLAETGMFRIKTILGRQLKCHTFENQACEARVWCSVMNKLTSLGLPHTIVL